MPNDAGLSWLVVMVNTLLMLVMLQNVMCNARLDATLRAPENATQRVQLDTH